jgi:hypothetical protein
LEPNWKDGTRTGPAVASGYRAAYSAQNNQMGRMFNGGINPGGFGSRNYLLTGNATDPEPIVYVAVVDSVGNWVYRLPADEAERIWPGIGRKRVAPTLQAAPSVRPAAVNPCTGGYCLVFTSNCQAANVTAAKAQGCAFNGDQGWCGNWFQRYADTGQPLVPSDDCKRDVRGGQTMPWCAEMVPTGPPAPAAEPGAMPAAAPAAAPAAVPAAAPAAEPAAEPGAMPGARGGVTSDEFSMASGSRREAERAAWLREYVDGGTHDASQSRMAAPLAEPYEP